MRNLRIQLLFSHLLLVIIMLAVVIGGVINVFHLGWSIDRILKNNYKSVVAAQNMKDALDNEDSAAIYFLAGQTQRARSLFQRSYPRFQRYFNVEIHNITETHEKQYADGIGDRYPAYQSEIQSLIYAKPPISHRAAQAYYLNKLHPDCLAIKKLAEDVLKVNQVAILRADARAKAEARSASWTGIGAAVGALLLAVFLAIRMINAALAPLRALARQSEEIGAGHLNHHIEIHRGDEIGALATAFNRMTDKLREARQQELQRFQRAERMSDAALDSLYDPVIVTDGSGFIVHLNRTAEGLFGPVRSIAGKKAIQAIGEERITHAIEHAIHQEQVSAEEGEAAFVTLQTDISQRTYRIRATPMRDDENSLLGAAVVLEDVTHLRELDRLKSEFISVASHELRTPVTSLLLSVQLMEEGAAGQLTSEQKEIVSAQKDDLKRLDRMMRDLLDITRLEAGVTPPRFELVKPGELVNSALQSVDHQIKAKGLSIASEIPTDIPLVRADRALISRVLVNLLSNAIRHTPSGGRILVRVCPQDGRTAFSVTDSGVGIPAEYRPRIFERFVQVPGATRGGAGLGLSISKTIVKAHDGDISVESEPGKGSVFTFTLPVPQERKERVDGTDSGH